MTSEIAQEDEMSSHYREKSCKGSELMTGSLCPSAVMFCASGAKGLFSETAQVGTKVFEGPSLVGLQEESWKV